MVGIDSADAGHFAADAVEGLGGDVTAGLPGDGRYVEHTVGAAAGGHHVPHHIFHAALIDEVPGPDLLPPGAHHAPGGLPRQFMPLGRLAAGAGVAVGGQAQQLRHGAHGVGGAHKGTGAGGGTGAAHHALVILPGHAALHIGGVGLFGVGEGQHTALIVPGGHISAGEHDGGDVHPQGAHHHAGHHLVAGGQHDHALQAVELGHGLHLAGHQVPGGQGIAVAGGVAAHAVADAGDGQLQGQAARPIDLLLELSDQLLVKGEVAGVHLVPGVDDADDGPLRVLLAHAHGVQQRVAVVQRFLVPGADLLVRHDFASIPQFTCFAGFLQAMMSYFHGKCLDF